MMNTVENDWYCRATSFPQYLSSILSDATFPADCVAPGINIFKHVNVLYIEETLAIEGNIVMDLLIFFRVSYPR